MTYILLLPGSKVPYSVDICKFESYHNVYHDRSIHQCLQRINRENWICMRKHQHQLDRIYLAYKVLSQLPQLNIRCLPFFMYFVSTNFWSSSYTLQASRIFTLFCLVFLPPPPRKKKSSIPNPSTAPNQNPSASDIHTIEFFIKVLGSCFKAGSWSHVFVRTWNENREAKKQNQWKACIDIFQMIQMYGILITYMY